MCSASCPSGHSRAVGCSELLSDQKFLAVVELMSVYLRVVGSNCSQSQCPTNKYETPCMSKIRGKNEPLLTWLWGRWLSVGFGRLLPPHSLVSVSTQLAQQRPGLWLGVLGSTRAWCIHQVRWSCFLLCCPGRYVLSVRCRTVRLHLVML